MQAKAWVDLLVPRGGPEPLAQSKRTPPFQSFDGAGNCHVYVDAAADLDMAVPTSW